MERGTLDWRKFLSAVNLKDFSAMVLTELGLIGMSLRVALGSFANLPLGPPFFLAILVLAVLRLALLVLAIIVLGTAILVTMLVRAAFRAVGSLATRS